MSITTPWHGSEWSEEFKLIKHELEKENMSASNKMTDTGQSFEWEDHNKMPKTKSHGI